MRTLFIWLAVVLAISLVPMAGAARLPHADKLLHFAIYAITCALFFTYLRLKLPLLRALVLSVLLASLYGLGMEALQRYVPRRAFSWGDSLANALGALGAAVHIYIKRR